MEDSSSGPWIPDCASAACQPADLVTLTPETCSAAKQSAECLSVVPRGRNLLHSLAILPVPKRLLLPRRRKPQIGAATDHEDQLRRLRSGPRRHLTRGQIVMHAPVPNVITIPHDLKFITDTIGNRNLQRKVSRPNFLVCIGRIPGTPPRPLGSEDLAKPRVFGPAV